MMSTRIAKRQRGKDDSCRAVGDSSLVPHGPCHRGSFVGETGLWRQREWESIQAMESWREQQDLPDVLGEQKVT